LVTVNVGPEAKQFTVRRGLICHFSEYFKCVFHGNFVEAERRAITLEDVHPAVFNLFVKWMSFGVPDWTGIADATNGAYLNVEDGRLLPRQTQDAPKLRTIHEESDTFIVSAPVLGKNAESARCEICYLVDGSNIDGSNSIGPTSLDVFIFADEYDVPILRREAMIARQLYDEVENTLPRLSTIIKVESSLPHTSPFYKYTVDRVARLWKLNNCQKRHAGNEFVQKLPQNFMMALMDMVCDKSWDTEPRLRRKPCFDRHRDDRNYKNCVDCQNHDQRYKKQPPYNWCLFHEHKTNEEIEECRQSRGRIGAFGHKEAVCTLEHVFKRHKYYECETCWLWEWESGESTKCKWCELEQAQSNNRLKWKEEPTMDGFGQWN
jgi:hypothetical protein